MDQFFLDNVGGILLGGSTIAVAFGVWMAAIYLTLRAIARGVAANGQLIANHWHADHGSPPVFSAAAVKQEAPASPGLELLRP